MDEKSGRQCLTAVTVVEFSERVGHAVQAVCELPDFQEVAPGALGHKPLQTLEEQKLAINVGFPLLELIHDRYEAGRLCGRSSPGRSTATGPVAPCIGGAAALRASTPVRHRCCCRGCSVVSARLGSIAIAQMRRKICGSIVFSKLCFIVFLLLLLSY